MTPLGQDIRWAARSLRRTPATISIAILVMALGIGAATAVFSVVEAVLIRPLPYANSDRLAAISTVSVHDGVGTESRRVSLTELQAWRRDARSFQAMGAFAYTQLPIEIENRAFDPVTALVDPDLLTTLGPVVALGAPFDTGEVAATDHVVIISHRLWLDAFGGDRGAIGRRVSVDGEPFTVGGVLRDGFQFPRADASYYRQPVDLLVPAATYPNFPAASEQWLGIVKLKSQVAVAAAQQELEGIATRLAGESQGSNARSIRLTMLADATTRSSRPALLLTLGIALVLLVVAASNVMNLLLARGATRLHEMAIRRALGSTPQRIVRQLLCESTLVVGLGSVMGVGIAGLSVGRLVAMSPVYLPVTGRIGIDGVVLSFTGAVALVIALATGLMPALQVVARSSEALRNPGSRSTPSRSLARTQRWLCTVQMTLGVALLGVAGLLGRSMAHLNAVDPGFHVDSLLGFSLSVPGSHTMEERKRLYQRALDAIRTIPGVQGAGFITFLPPETRAGVFMGLTVAGEPPRPVGATPRIANTLITSPDYFETVGMTMARGRAFSTGDDERAQPVIIVNETAARELFPDRNPIGQHIGSGFDGKPVREIVGVVHDTHDRGLGMKPIPTVYIPFPQFALMYGSIVVRARVAPAALIAPIRETLASLDPSIPLSGFQTIRQRVFQSLEEQRFYTTLAGVCAAMAVLFVAMGVYGIISFSVAARSPEFGIRMAIGAQRANIVALVLGQGMRMAGVSVVVGSLLAVGLGRGLRTLLFEIGPADPATLVGAASVVVLAMVVATMGPAIRAGRVSPMVALRAE